MKRFKGVVLALLVAMAFSTAWADETTPPVNGRFIGGIGLGGAPQLGGFSDVYNTGGAGIDGYLGFTVDKNLSFVMAIDSFIFSTSNSNVYVGEVNFVPSVKYAFGNAKTRFYLIGGLGLNDSVAYYQDIYGTSSFSQTNFVIEPGAGVQIYLNGALNLYVQMKVVNVFAAGDFSYLPITLGLDFK